MSTELPRANDPLPAHPDLTHRPLTEDAFDLDSLAPRERERVQEVMAKIEQDMQALVQESLDRAKLPLVEQAQLMVDDWNKDDGAFLRPFAESMTGFPVESCKAVLDGVQGRDILISYQIERARRGEHYDRWVTEQEDTFGDAREHAKRVLHENLPDDGLEPKTMGDLLTGNVQEGDVIPFVDGSSIEVVVGPGTPGWKSDQVEADAE